MTKEEILNMPAGVEIDNLIAEKVMGWHLVDNHWKDEDNRFQCGVGGGGYGYEDDEDIHTLHWHPSESIKWAWDVVEKVGIGMLNSVHGIWECYVGNVVGKSKSASLAICRAALLSTFVED